jgi:hypothetical protein
VELESPPLPVSTPSSESHEQFPEAVMNDAGDVVMTWNVGPVSANKSKVRTLALIFIAP